MAFLHSTMEYLGKRHSGDQALSEHQGLLWSDHEGLGATDRDMAPSTTRNEQLGLHSMEWAGHAIPGRLQLVTHHYRLGEYGGTTTDSLGVSSGIVSNPEKLKVVVTDQDSLG